MGAANVTIRGWIDEKITETTGITKNLWRTYVIEDVCKDRFDEIAKEAYRNPSSDDAKKLKSLDGVVIIMAIFESAKKVITDEPLRHALYNLLAKQCNGSSIRDYQPVLDLDLPEKNKNCQDFMWDFWQWWLKNNSKGKPSGLVCSLCASFGIMCKVGQYTYERNGNKWNAEENQQVAKVKG